MLAIFPFGSIEDKMRSDQEKVELTYSGDEPSPPGSHGVLS